MNGYLVSTLIPPLPSTLKHLTFNCLNRCLPVLPNSLESLFAIYAHCLPNRPSALNFCVGPFVSGSDTTYCSILNSMCPGGYSAIAGRHHIDLNTNGQVDPGEPAFPWGRVEIQPMNAIVPANAAGWWERGAPEGSYSILPTSTYPYLMGTAPASHTAVFQALGEVDSTNHFAHALLPGIQDLRATGLGEVARPGFDNHVHLSFDNYGTTTLPADLQFTFDNDQSWVGSVPPPTTLAGHTATWSLPNLPVGTQGQILVTLHTPAAVPLGTPLQHHVVIEPVAGDTTPMDNMYLWNDTVVGSYDPNDKLLSPAVATPTAVQNDEVTITYTIRFQNTGTYLAERVVILDTLSADLRWSTFDLLGSSHPNQWYLLDGVLHVIHEGIMLPDSASDELNSHGHVRFSIKPSTQLALGDQVANIAHIVFDFNEPIVTDSAVFSVDVSTGVKPQAATGLSVWPNPVRDRLLITGITEASTLRVLDLGGRQVAQHRLAGQAWIDVSMLAPGVYVCEWVDRPATAPARFVKE